MKLVALVLRVVYEEGWKGEHEEFWGMIQFWQDRRSFCWWGWYLRTKFIGWGNEFLAVGSVGGDVLEKSYGGTVIGNIFH